MNDLHHIVLEARGTDAAEALVAMLDGAAEAVSAFQTAPGEWRVEAYARLPLATSALLAQLALAAAAAGGELCEFRQQRLPERDWLAENQLAFPPLRLGRFFVYGSHYRGSIPSGAIGILLDAATAFGTGEHPSTRGCLKALAALAARQPIRRALDIGTGTGILAIAAAKLAHRPVLASDIERGAVAVARRNAGRNRVTGFVRVAQRAGLGGGALRERRFDLIMANILARPLAVMAADFAGRLAPGGRLVLSGLLRRQEPIVLAPCRALGLALEKRIVIEGWSTLILRAGNRQTAGGVRRSPHL